MSPPQWLIEYWKNNTSWIKRYQRESWSVNAQLCNIDYDKNSTLWNVKNIKLLEQYIKKNSTKLTKELILYRGTENISPLMSNFDYKMNNCQYISTSKSRAIAKEFTRKNGFLHILYCQKGILIYDMKNDYENDGVKREKEVLILPNHQLILLEFKKNIVKWKISIK